MKEIYFNKLTRGAGLLSMALVITLIVSIMLTGQSKYRLKKDKMIIEYGLVSELVLDPADFFWVKDDEVDEITFDVSKVDLTRVGTYEVYAYRGGKEFVIQVIIEDTIAPIVTFKEKYIFTNDISKLKDFSSMFESVEESSEYTVKLIQFEKEYDLSEMDNNVLKELSRKLQDGEMISIGTMTTPTKEGVYRSILAIEDEHGNVTHEEIFVILDTIGAQIEEVEDLVVYVESKSKLSEKPEIVVSRYKAFDNVDGNLKGEDLKIELKERNKEKHEWLTCISYADRAGNITSAEFLITVKLRMETSSTNTNVEDTMKESAFGVTQSGYYDSIDKNKDGIISQQEGNDYMSPDKQACLNEGLGKVVSFNNGEYYMVATLIDGHNGVRGTEILYNYISSMGFNGQIVSHSSDSNYIWYIAYDLYKPITEKDQGFWN